LRGDAFVPVFSGAQPATRKTRGKAVIAFNFRVLNV